MIENASMGSLITRVGRLHADLGQRIHRRRAHEIPQLDSRKRCTAEMPRRSPSERPDDARAHFLQVLEERHAQHALIVFIVRPAAAEAEERTRRPRRLARVSVLPETDLRRWAYPYVKAFALTSNLRAIYTMLGSSASAGLAALPPPV